MMRVIAFLLALAGVATAQTIYNSSGTPFSPPAITCSNQFIRSIAAATGIGTCASIASGDLSSLAGQYPGVTTNTAASAGNIGEILTATATTVSVSNATAATITSQSLTAGDWDVWCVFRANPAAGTTTSFYQAELSPTNNVTPSTLGNYTILDTSLAASIAYTAISPVVPISLSGSTTYFCVINIQFAVSTMTVDAKLTARRRH